ncbi:Ribosome biogenesis protein NSA2 [Merluccius polli]|uniref:Ribosome biogenesis protein NSA2 n=1 Tax=Merluccius polli TaxID=89951 RepID=A0AA47P4M7_MERPO|nr:Ribosome biogenesis protein NSA2 [Merluccius polli]
MSPAYPASATPMEGLRFKKAHVTHPELKATFCLPILGVKKNPSSPLYTSLGVITKGTVVEVNVSESGHTRGQGSGERPLAFIAAMAHWTTCLNSRGRNGTKKSTRFLSIKLEFGAAHSLHSSTFDGQWWVFGVAFPELLSCTGCSVKNPVKNANFGLRLL